MRTFDLAPLYRSTVGFDRLFSMLDGFESTPGYPPYNIERTGENDYRVTVAVAGFGENELSIEAKENTLTIKGNKQVKEEQNGEVLYQGIAARAFERVFQLADHVQVKNAKSREWIAPRRSRARNPRGQEAAPDPDRQRQSQGSGDRDQSGLRSGQVMRRQRPRNSGALSLLEPFVASHVGASGALPLREFPVRGPVLAWLRKPRRHKGQGSTHSGVDQPCMAGQNLAWSIRTILLS